MHSTTTNEPNMVDTFKVSTPLPSPTDTANVLTASAEPTSSPARTETPSTPSTEYHSASEGNSRSSSSTAHSKAASTAAPAVSFDLLISSPTPTRPQRPSTPGTQLTHSSRYSSESDLDDDTDRAKGYGDGKVAMEEEKEGSVACLKSHLLLLAGIEEDSGVNRLNSAKPRPGRLIRNKVPSSSPASIMSSPSDSNQKTVSEAKNKSAEKTRLPSVKSIRLDKQWPPGSSKMLDNSFDSEPPQSPGRLHRYFGRSVGTERVIDMLSTSSPSRTGSISGSEPSFNVSSLPPFKSTLSGLPESPVSSSLPAARHMPVSDSLSPAPVSLLSSLVANEKTQETAAFSSRASGSRLVNTNEGLSGERTSLDKLGSCFKSPSAKKSRIPRPVSHSFQTRPRSRSLSPTVRVQKRVASPSSLADPPKEKNRKLDPDTEED